MRGWRADGEGLTTLSEFACTTARSEEADVADADKALRQAFERGTTSRALVLGWINVNWSNTTRTLTKDQFACGDSDVARNPGTINFYYKSGQNNPLGGCRCAGQSEMGSRVVSHELGHALGFWHAGAVNDVMFPGTGNYCDATLSAREKYHAAIAYSRPVGNRDPDDDSSTTTILSLPRVTVY